jgi:hypothetical protein
MTASTITGPHSADASMPAVAERLSRHGLDVRFPQRAESCTLNVISAGNIRCDVIVDDEAGAAGECNIAPTKGITPARISPLVACMLGIEYTDPGRYAALRRGVPLAGAVARDMVARGLHAAMDVIEDHESYQVFADVIISNPARPGRGKVHIGDDGWVYWECDRDEFPGGTDGFADTIARFLTGIPPATVRERPLGRLRRLSVRRVRARTRT